MARDRHASGFEYWLGFLISGPLLAREFGSGALAAMALPCTVGWVVRFNIIPVENHTSAFRLHEPFASNGLITVIIVTLTALTFSGSIRKIEHAAHASVSVKLALIAGLLAGLAWWWISGGAGAVTLPPVRAAWHSLPMLMGLLITVQGFETSRYLGDTYDQATRVQTMLWPVDTAVWANASRAVLFQPRYP